MRERAASLLSSAPGHAREALHNPRIRIGAVALLMALLVTLLLPRLLPGTSSEEFIVLVAPFRDTGGDVGQTGRAVAQDLARAIAERSEGTIATQVLDVPPADAAEAARITRQRSADVLVWGEVAPGGMLDQETLLPEIAYQPSGSFAPTAWDGYLGRFSMPDHFALTSRPVVGGTVVPQLLQALADYSAGRVDRALQTLDALASEQPALLPELPASLRGNLLWARGEYAAAADSYRRAIGAARGPSAARLSNNLGAILQDAGQPAAAREALNQAVAQLDGADLGELRYNLAIEALRAGEPEAAVAAIDAIAPRSTDAQRRLLPPSTPVLLTQSRAYRLSGQLDRAADWLSAADRQSPIDELLTTPELRDVLSLHLRSAVLEERALLGLARAVRGSGPLVWELQANSALRPEVLNTVGGQLDTAISEAERAIDLWTRRAAAEDASGNTIAGRVAVTQAQRAAATLDSRRRWATVLDIERLQQQGARPRQGVGALWAALTGAGSPVTPIQRELLARSAANPADPEPLVLLGDVLLLAGDSAGAREQYQQAATLAPQRPEPAYGLARVALAESRPRGRELLAQAIALDPTYFPARIALAEAAEQDRDWPAAIEQRRWLSQNRPGADTALALAATLRLSGPAGYAEAEQTLLPLANQDNVGALIELAEVYRAAGDQGAVRAALERAQKITPRGADRYADVTYEMGRLLVDEGNIPEAEIQFESALSADPRHVPSLLALAQINRAEPQLATRHYRAALDAGADDADVLLRIGSTLLAYREYELAASAYERAIGVSGGSPAAHYGLAVANLRLKRLAAAQNEASAAIAANGGSYPEAQVVLGDVALQQGNIAAAVQEYNAALRQSDDLAAAYIGLGRASAAEGNWSVALGHFRNATERDAQSAEAHLWLGEALLRQSDARGAADAYAEALARRPDYAEALLGLAQAQIQLGQIPAAEESLRRAVESQPQYAEAHLVRGRLYEQQGQDGQALEAYARAIDSGDRLAEPHYRRALILIRTGRLDDARGDLEAAARIQPNFPEAQYWLGRVLFAQNRFDLAAERFRTAVALQPAGYPEARYYQGLAEERAGHPAEAAASYRAAAEQGAGSIWGNEASEALSRLSGQ